MIKAEQARKLLADQYNVYLASIDNKIQQAIKAGKNETEEIVVPARIKDKITTDVKSNGYRIRFWPGMNSDSNWYTFSLNW